METELLLAETAPATPLQVQATSNAPSQSDEETDGAAEAVDPSETLDFFHGWWQAHGALPDQVYQQTPNYWLGWHQGREHAQRQAQQEPGSASSSSSSWGVPQAAGWPTPESPASATGVFGAAFLEAEQSPADSLRVTSGGSEGRLA